MLTDFRDKPTQPNYIVLALPEPTLGHTLFNKAHILFTYAPDSLTELT